MVDVQSETAELQMTAVQSHLLCRQHFYVKVIATAIYSQMVWIKSVKCRSKCSNRIMKQSAWERPAGITSAAADRQRTMFQIMLWSPLNHRRIKQSEEVTGWVEPRSRIKTPGRFSDLHVDKTSDSRETTQVRNWNTGTVEQTTSMRNKQARTEWTLKSNCFHCSWTSVLLTHLDHTWFKELQQQMWTSYRHRIQKQSLSIHSEHRSLRSNQPSNEPVSLTSAESAGRSSDPYCLITDVWISYNFIFDIDIMENN